MGSVFESVGAERDSRHVKNALRQQDGHLKLIRVHYDNQKHLEQELTCRKIH